MSSADWISNLTNVIALLVSVTITASVVLFKIGKILGEAKRTLEDYEGRLIAASELIVKQQNRETQIISTIASLEAIVRTQEASLVSNEKAHGDIFRRLQTLEVEVAKIPDLVSCRLEEKFDKWEKRLHNGNPLEKMEDWK